MVGRVHIEPDDVANLAHEQRVTRELERLAAVRLRGKSMSDAHNCRLAQPDRLRQAARSGVCRQFARPKRVCWEADGCGLGW
jgi:hypothetical protein